MVDDDEILAKSDPFQTLKEHTEELLRNCCLLRESYLLPLTAEDWETIEKACFFHDFGKANDYFQARIRKKYCSYNLNFPHSFLSTAFILENDELLVRLIAFHHWRNFLSYRNVDLKLVYKKMEKYLLKMSKDFQTDFKLLPFSVFRKRIKKLWSHYQYRLDMPLSLKEDNRFIIFLGLLNRIDHASSAGVAVEKTPVEKFSLIQNYLWQKTDNPWQLMKLQNQYQYRSGVVVASTGLGKTEMGLLWSGRDKTFYTLPVRTSVNAMFDRLVNYFGRDNVGLLHSDAFGKIICGMEEKYDTDDALVYYDTARCLSFPITVSTADQIFTAALKFFGFEKIYATLAYSKIIVDEIQAYSPHTSAIVVQALREIQNLGGKYLVLTATLPPIIRDYLEYDFYIEHVPNLKKHRIKLVAEEITCQVVQLVERYKGKKILIVCNTVEKARSIYKILNDHCPWLQKFDPDKNCLEHREYPLVLFHSRFTSWDKRMREHAVLDKNFIGILVATQVVEVSLDIDFDLLLTEIAPLEVLIQRMGRIYRRYKEDGFHCPMEPNVYIFTEKPSGISTIYESDIISRTLSLFQTEILSEHDKLDMINDLYSKDSLKNTAYLTNFLSALEILGNFTEKSKDKAQQLFREIDSIYVLPCSLLESPVKNLFLLQSLHLPEGITLRSALAELKFENRSQKMLVYEMIKDFLVPVRAWSLQKARVVDLSSFVGRDIFRGIPVVEGEYNKNEGFIYNLYNCDNRTSLRGDIQDNIL